MNRYSYEGCCTICGLSRNTGNHAKCSKIKQQTLGNKKATHKKRLSAKQIESAATFLTMDES